MGRYLLETRDFLVSANLPSGIMQAGGKLPSDKQIMKELGLKTQDLKEAYNYLKFVLLPA